MSRAEFPIRRERDNEDPIDDEPIEADVPLGYWDRMRTLLTRAPVIDDDAEVDDDPALSGGRMGVASGAAAVVLAALLAACDAATPSATAAPPPAETAHQVTLGVASYQPRGATFFGTSWRLPEGAEVYVPLAIDVGCTIDGWTINVQHNAATSKLTAALQYAEPLTSAVYLVGEEQSALGLVGGLTLEATTSHMVAAKADYSIRVARDFVAGSDYVFAGELRTTCPVQ